MAESADGTVISEQSRPDGRKFGHADAIEHLAAFLREGRGDMRFVGVGHRVVHGGTMYFELIRVGESKNTNPPGCMKQNALNSLRRGPATVPCSTLHPYSLKVV